MSFEDYVGLKAVLGEVCAIWENHCGTNSSAHMHHFENIKCMVMASIRVEV